VRLVIPDFVSNSYFPAIAAAELGLLRREGLDVDEAELLFPVTTAMEALRDGQLDFVVGAAHATMQAFEDWRGARLLAAVGRYMYWFLVLRSDLDAARGDVAAVRGLRIGAAPGPDLGLLRLLKQGGLEPGNDVQVGPVPGTSGSTSFGVTAAQALEDGLIDGFWANGMGAEVAVQRGVGTVVLDARRGDGPPEARNYTFAALVTRQDVVERAPELAAAAIRGLTAAQALLRAEPQRATDIGRKVFPAMEAELIAELIRRDAPYYDAAITPEAFRALNEFGLDMGILTKAAAYEDVVAAQFSRLWSGQVP